jgi:hypothetical protein
MQTSFLRALTITICLGQALAAAAQTAPVLAGATYDPGVNPLARQLNGQFTWLIANDVLVRSLRAAMPDVGTVERIEPRRIAGADHLVFEAREAEAPERLYRVAVRLYQDAGGYLYATAQGVYCKGEDRCSDCGLSEACPCASNPESSCSGGSLGGAALAPVSTAKD